MRRLEMLAIAGVLAAPWIGTLVWMQLTGEAAEAAYESYLMSENQTSMEESRLEGGILEGAKAAVGSPYADGQGTDAWAAGAGAGESGAGTAGPGSNGAGTAGPGSNGAGTAGPESNGAGTGDGGPVINTAGNAGKEDGKQAVSARKILVERGNVSTYMNLEDYLPGVIVCQMPEDIDGGEFDPEVWKCQAVVARTYICRLMEGRDEIHEEELDMDYLGETRSLRGSSKDDVVRRLELAKQAAADTQGIVMKYEDRYILPLFHEMSAGRTRQGHVDFPYIQSVDSSRDTGRNTYLTIMEWGKSEFAEKISQIPDAAPVAAGQLPQEIQTVEKDDAGYLLQIKIGARTYTGDEVRWALGLPSSCFSLEGDGDLVRARVKGRGHGYGLSQAGADSMAADGWGYEEILRHYYKNISLIFE